MLDQVSYDPSIRLSMILTPTSERILIGTSIAIESCLRTGSNEEILFEYNRPFGSLLLDLEHDQQYLWNIALSNLRDAYNLKHHPMEYLHERFDEKKTEKRCKEIALSILQDKYNQDNPISKYVALKIWFSYKSADSIHTDIHFDNFMQKMVTLTRPLQSEPIRQLEPNIKVLPGHILLRWSTELSYEDREMVIVKPYKKIPDEYILADLSLIPLKNYYIEKLQHWDKYLLQCKVCGTFFIASNLHPEYCSSTCRSTARIEQLKARAEIPSVKKLDKLCRREYQHWYNRLRKIKASGKWTEEQIMHYKLTMEKFQNEKNTKRQQYSNGDISYKELLDWFSSQREIADQFVANL